jgi:ketosteroid isomerase-like protein
MTESRLKEFFAACNDRDITRLASFFTDDAVYLGSIGPDDDGTRFVGVDEIRRGLGAFLGSHTSLLYDDLDMLIAGDRGFAMWSFAGTRLDGSDYTYRGVDIFAFKGDRITSKDAFRKERANPMGS